MSFCFISPKIRFKSLSGEMDFCMQGTSNRFCAALKSTILLHWVCCITLQGNQIENLIVKIYIFMLFLADERPVSIEDTLLLCPAPVINETGR